MSAQPNEPVALPKGPSADDGPIPEIVAGFESRHLELVEDDEELFALEAETDDGPDELPDEADDASGGGGPTGGADAGEVTELHPGFDATSIDAVEGDEELNALEAGLDGLALPGETSLADQPSKAPSRKVKAAGLGGLIAALPVSLIAALDTISVSESVLTAIGSALTLLGALAAAYLARERTPAP